MRGLYKKYVVVRRDLRDLPNGDKADAEYFVLDVKHDKRARDALAWYAKECFSDNPILSVDLLSWVERLTSEPAANDQTDRTF